MPDQMKLRVTPEQVEVARTNLAEAGFPITGESSTIEKGGYRIGYSLSDGVLMLEVVAKPRFVHMVAVRARIRSMLSKEGIVELA